MSALLEARLTVGYGSVVVGRGIELEVAAGEVCAVIGPNGAGKSTLLSTIAGLLPAVSGSVSVAGEPIQTGSARRMSKAGVVLVPDHRALFTGLSTLENLRVADRSDGVEVDRMLDLFPRLADKSRLAAGKLSGGEQQMLALARALVQRPRVLLIDEMSMGLAPQVVESLVQSLRSHAETSGTAVVLVEQHVHVALEAADRALVLVHGDVVLSGTAKEVASHPELHSAYLGAGAETPVDRRPGN